MSPDRLPADRLLPLLAERRAALSGPVAIASDGDDTLWRGDVGEDLFERAVNDGALRAAALDALANEACTWGIDGGGDANAIGRRLLAAHRAGGYPAPPAYAMMAWAFAGWEVGELDAYCQGSLDAFDFDDRVMDWIGPVLTWAAQAGVSFHLVSASPKCIAAAAAKRMGIEHVVAMTPAQAGGVLMPRLGLRATYGEGKPIRFRAETDATLLAGCGDSAFDAALMAEAIVAVAVRPKPTLVERLDALTGPVVVVEG
jgi:phosphatidylglycerophosphatase C